jgi:predicted MFS family arabinose efflux permease
MLCCFVAAPALGVVRVFAGSEQAHIVLAFFAGVAMCTWGVCFLPTVAGLTSNGNRASAFGLIFSVSIGTSALGGLLCGYLPQWIRWAGGSLTSAQVKQRILLGACAVALVGLLFVLRLRLPRAEESRSDRTSWLRLLGGGEFLRRFLPGMMLWSAVIAAFTPFASVYLSRSLNVSLAHVGLVFSISQIVQLCLGLLTPLLFRALGLSNGVLATQVVAAALLAALAGVRGELAAVLLFVGFSAMQWMSSPGIYNLLMTGTADRDRSSAAALALFLNALAGSASTAIAGLGFSRYGYPKMLLGVAALALVAALAMRWSFSGRESFDPLDIPAAEVTT